ncbi:MAG: high-affinity branched-chain amino acid ABC transporter permease LivM, partial [Pseudomonadota bacterium]
MAHIVVAQPAPAERLKDAAWIAFVALILGIPMIGLTTADSGGALAVHTRWPLLAAMVAAVFAGRLVLRYVADLLRARAKPEDKPLREVRPYARWIGAAGLAFALALPFLPFANRYVVDTATTVLIYVMLGWGLNVVVGLAGLLDLGYVAFYAVGAYSYALLATHFDWSFWLCLPLAGALAAAFGMLLGYPTLRLRGDYLAIVTLGFGEIIRVILVNWTEFSGGPNGISSIPRPTLFGLQFKAPSDDVATFAGFFGLEFNPEQRIVFLYFLILFLALATNLFVTHLRRLPLGRAWEAMREDEIACKALGLNTTNIKLSAYAIGAMLG